jgi:hypothetical protein
VLVRVLAARSRPVIPLGRERTAERGHRHSASLKAWRRALQLIGGLGKSRAKRGPALMGAVWDRATPYATRLLRSQVTLLSVNYL